MDEWIKEKTKQDPVICNLQETHFNLKIFFRHLEFYKIRVMITIGDKEEKKEIEESKSE